MMGHPRLTDEWARQLARGRRAAGYFRVPTGIWIGAGLTAAGLVAAGVVLCGWLS